MKKILLIEDNKEVRENTAEILELAHYEVHTAKNGKEGVEVALREKPDLIICDIMMPVLDGYGVLHLLSKDESSSNIPFIFLSAKAERSDVRKGMEMGADDYLTKPFDDIELLNAIETRLRKQEMSRKVYENNREGLDAFLQDASEQLKLVSDDRETASFKKKQSIYSINKRPINLFYVIKGKVKTYRMNDDGKEFITGMYTEGEFFGYLPLLEETNYKDSADSFEDCELMMIPREQFSAIIAGDARVRNNFMRMLANNIDEKERQLVGLAYNSLRKRVADGLLMVTEKFRKTSNKPEIQISRDDLAHVVGTATESLIRTLSDFKGEKLIEIRDGKIVLLNEDKLRSMLN